MRAGKANLSKGSDAKPPVCGIDLIEPDSGVAGMVI
jgi:hypothetical protein